MRKTRIFILNLILFIIFCFKISAFEINPYSYNTYLYNEKTKINQDNQTMEVKKGFTFTLNFKIPKNIDCSINLTDIVIKHLKSLFKENLNNKYVNQIFKNYKINYNNKKCFVTFYVYPSTGEYSKIKKFVINKFLDKDLSDFFSEEKIKQKDYEDFMSEYKEVLEKKSKIFINKIIKNYRENNYSKLYDIFYNLSSNFATTANIVSSISQHKKIRKLSENIRKDLKTVYDKKLKHKFKYNDFSDYYYKEYGDNFFKKSYKFLDELDDDDKEYDEDYDDEDDDKEDYDDEDDDDNYEIFNKLEKKLTSFIKICENNIEKLNNLNSYDIRDSIVSVSFEDEIKPIEKNIIKFDGVIEKIVKR